MSLTFSVVFRKKYDDWSLIDLYRMGKINQNICIMNFLVCLVFIVF